MHISWINDILPFIGYHQTSSISLWKPCKLYPLFLPGPPASEVLSTPPRHSYKCCKANSLFHNLPYLSGFSTCHMQYKLRGLVWMIALRKWRPTVRHQKAFRNFRAFREQQWHVLEEASSYRVPNVWKHGVWWGKLSTESHTLICSIRQAYWNPLFPTSRSSAWLRFPPHSHRSPVATSQPSPSWAICEGSLTDGAFLWFHCRHYFPIVIESSPSQGYIRAVTVLYYIIAITFRGYTTTLLWLHHPHAPPVFVSGSHHAPITFRGLCITQVISHNQCLLKLVGHSIQFCAIWRPI